MKRLALALAATLVAGSAYAEDGVTRYGTTGMWSIWQRNSDGLCIANSLMADTRTLGFAVVNIKGEDNLHLTLQDPKWEFVTGQTNNITIMIKPTMIDTETLESVVSASFDATSTAMTPTTIGIDIPIKEIGDIFIHSNQLWIGKFGYTPQKAMAAMKEVVACDRSSSAVVANPFGESISGSAPMPAVQF